MYDKMYTINVEENEYIFEWDIDKEKANIKKHGLDFCVAALCYLDNNAIEYFDKEHSDFEERWACIGTFSNLIVKIIYTRRENVIRIISARMATKKEEAAYYGENS